MAAIEEDFGELKDEEQRGNGMGRFRTSQVAS